MFVRPEVVPVELAIVFMGVLTVLAVENLTTRRSTRRTRELVRAAAPVGHASARTEPACDNAESALATRLLTGQLDQAGYHDAMAALASADQRTTGVNPLRLLRLAQDACDQIADLQRAMPTLSPTTIFTAIALAHEGATVECLMRRVGLTNAQALRVIITTASKGGRRG